MATKKRRPPVHVTDQRTEACRGMIRRLVFREMRGLDKENALAILSADRQVIQHLKAIVRSLRSKNGQLTKQAREDREAGYKALSEATAEQAKRTQVADLAIVAILMLDLVDLGEVAYFVREQLKQDLAAIYPAIRPRLGLETLQGAAPEPEGK